MYHPVLQPGQKSLWMGQWAAAAILGSMVLFSKMSLCKILNNHHLLTFFQAKFLLKNAKNCIYCYIMG
jgi:hypothetical protein